MSTIGDGTAPVYEFDWGDRTRTTESLTVDDDRVDELMDEMGIDSFSRSIAIEELAELGRDDDECEVTLVGFE